MKLKLGENLGTRTRRLFLDKGHDVETVWDKGMRGTPDRYLYDTCRREERCLVTLDLDFADVTRFPPANTHGIVVLRLPRSSSLELLEALVRQFMRAVGQTSVQGKLWIVEAGRIRVHEPDIDE